MDKFDTVSYLSGTESYLQADRERVNEMLQLLEPERLQLQEMIDRELAEVSELVQRLTEAF